MAIKGVSDQLDVASPGQSIWLRSSGSVSSATGCHLHYRLYLPLDMSSEASIRSLVVLGHGFLRSQEHMRDLATAIARSGVPVATLDFCNTRLWDGRHFRNGLDMIRVADALEAERRIYAGFSAGALAALVAAHVDSNSLGIVGLDLVDAQGLGKRLAASLRRPIFGVFGDPSRCNAQNNGLAVLSAARQQASVEHVPGAGHCDFESPTDWLCVALCAGGSRPEPDARELAIELATRAIGSLR